MTGTLKKLIAGVLLILAAAACSSNADVASHNLSKAADDFQIRRRIVFYNGITGDYMLAIERRCSLGNDDPPRELSVTCEIGHNKFKKDFLGLSDNVTYFAEQIDAVGVSKYQYRVFFKPKSIVPDIGTR